MQTEAHHTQAHEELKDTHMQTLVGTAVVCSEMVNDKQRFVFPCWHCNVLLSSCIPCLSPPLPSHLLPSFPSRAQLCLSPSSPHSPRLPVCLYHEPSLCLTSTHPHLSLCLVLFSPHLPPSSLWTCYRVILPPICQIGNAFVSFSSPLCQFVWLPFAIASLHKPAHPHLSFSVVFVLPPIQIYTGSPCHSSFPSQHCRLFF